MSDLFGVGLIEINCVWSLACNQMRAFNGLPGRFHSRRRQGDNVHGQMQACTIKARKEDGNVVHMIAACADQIMTSNVQFSAKIIDENTITCTFPGMPEFSINYSCCP